VLVITGQMLQETTRENPLGRGRPAEGAPFQPGTLVDHFKVIRMVGRGGMGEVYLARDVMLGRRVALKVIRRRSRGTERFLQEARTTARFSHPHIVTIYAVGQHEGWPYLALEFLAGRTLRDRINEGSIGVKESLRIGIAIAEALEEAHRHNVVHLDLKPENMVIPRDGRLRVVDFGLAEVFSPVLGDTLEISEPNQPTLPLEEGCVPARHRKLQGTPAYMAPEQWAQEEVGAAADIWALGVILHELVTGHRPFPVDSVRDLLVMVTGTDRAPSLPGVTPAHAELVRRCLEKAPSLRPSSAEVAETLREILATARGRPTWERCPFRGLESFGEEHAHLFYGREAEVDAFVERMRETPVLPVVGPSGSGKSSFVQAGVIPQLRDRGTYTVIRLRPGRRPFRSLSARLGSEECLTDEITRSVPGLERSPGSTRLAAEQLESQLRKTPRILAHLLESIAATRQGRVVLFVDQLEELFTLCDDRETAGAFLEAICAAADDPQGPTRVIFTLREDFLGRLAGPARDALAQVTLVGPPDREALRKILFEPIRALDYHYDDPTLVDEMIAAAGEEPAALPLVQFTANLLWERRDRKRRVLTRAAHDELGGVAGAIAAHADGVLAGLPAPALGTVRELLLRLVTAERTRRVVPLTRLLDGLAGDAEELLGQLVKARMVSVRKARERADEEAEVELAHESLMLSWTRLARWIERSRDEIAFLDEVGQAAELWRRHGRRDDDLLHGDSLRDARAALERCAASVPEEIIRFLDAGRRVARRRSRRRRQLAAAVVTLALVIAAVLAYQKRQADIQRRSARARWAEAQRVAALAAAVRGDPLEARAKLRGSLETEDSALARTLWQRLSKDPLRWRHRLGAVVYSVAFSPDGTTVAAATQDRQVALFDARTRRARTLRGFRDQVLSVAFSPAGNSIAAGTWSGQVTVRTLDPGAPAELRLLTGHRDAVRWLAFSPDGGRLASASLDRTIRIWDLRQARAIRVLRNEGGVVGVAFSPDGGRIASGGQDRRVRIWEVDRPGAPIVLEGHGAAVSDVAFSPDGELLASASTDRTVRLWRLRGNAAPVVLADARAGINRVCFSPDGRLLATGGYDQLIRVWDLASLTVRNRLRGHGGPIFGLAFGPRGQRLLSGGQDRTIGLWQIPAPGAGSGPDRVLRGHHGQVAGLGFSPDDRLLASGGEDGTVRLWDVESGAPVRTLRGHDGRVSATTFSPDGRFLASAGQDRTVRLWDLKSSLGYRILGSHWSRVYELAFSPDGRWLASAANDKRIRIWDVAAAVQHAVLSGHRDAVFGLDFSPDGKRLASAGRDRVVRLWDVEGARPLDALEGHDAPIASVRFTPDGRQLVTAGYDGAALVWDLARRTHRVLERRDGRAYSLDLHGALVGVPRSDGSASLLAIDDAWPPRRLQGHRAEVNRLRFSHDGRLVATASDNGTVRVWHVDSGRPHWRATAMIGSPPVLATHRGWIRPTDGRPAAAPVGRSLAAAIERRARRSDAAPGGRVVCLVTEDGELELWDAGLDRKRQHLATSVTASVVATDGACLALHDGQARLLGAEGLLGRWPASAATWSDGQLLLASGREVLVLSESGALLRRQPGDEGVTAIARAGGRIMLGFADGNIELVPQGGVTFEKLPSSPVVRLVAGPRETIIAGHASGALGIWHLGNGGRLDHAHLHGPVVHVRLDGRRLHAATELGDHATLDLSAFHLSYCALLRRVWGDVGVVWERRQAVLRAPPDGHPCR